MECLTSKHLNDVIIAQSVAPINRAKENIDYLIEQF